MATNIPPHNLSEIIDATIHLIRNPSCTIDDLMRFVPGPDFPTGGLIYGRARHRAGASAPAAAASSCARASRSRRSPGSGEREQIVVTEIPTR